MAISRRTFLEMAALLGGGMALRSLVSPGIATASPGEPQLLLFCYMQGGWDQLLAFDPRPNDQPKYKYPQAAEPGGTGIAPVYELIKDSHVASVLAANPSGVQKIGNLTFGPAVPPALMQHAQDISIIRGILMGTLTHDVGKRYFITGKFPRGVAANGSALPTAVAAAEGIKRLVPNLAVGSETYNESFPSYASGINVVTSDDVRNLIRPLGMALAKDSDAALLHYETTVDNCQQHALDDAGLVDLFKQSRAKARTMIDPEGDANLFKFTLPPPPETAGIMEFFGITKSSDLLGPKAKAAIGVQALSLGIAQAVSVEIARDLDDHGDWALAHGTSLWEGFDLLGRIITYLKKTPYAPIPETSTWEHTTLLVFSEFARTPLINGREGRDHHQYSSCLVAGPKIKGNMVVGATDDNGMTARRVDLSTGLPDPGGEQLRPTDVHATVLTAMGIPYDHLGNTAPKVITSLLKA